MDWRSRLLLASLVGLSLSGCSDAQYTVVDVPFCATDEPGVHPQLAKRYVIITRGDDEYSVGEMSQRIGAPHRLGSFQSARVRMALVECAEAPGRSDIEWAKQLDDNEPSVCVGQRVVFNQEIEAVADERSKGLGYGGFLHFPTVNLECTAGQMVQDNDHTLSQILDDFVHSVDRYVVLRESLPSSFEQLAGATKAPPLPPDPWGSAIKFQTDAPSGTVTQIRLLSAGPDQAFDTEDDVEVLTKQKGSSTNITVFPGVDQAVSGNYTSFLESRGIKL